MSSPGIHATLRPALPTEARRLVAFYESANDPNVTRWPEENYRKAAESRLFFVIEDSHGELVAASGVFTIADHVTDVLEAGGTFITLPFRGFKLQDLLLQVRVASVVVHRYGAAIVVAVKASNATSLRNVVGAGFAAWSSPIEELFGACATCEHRAALVAKRCCCDYYKLGEDESKANVARLLASGPVWTQTRADGARLTVRLQGPLLENREHLDELHAYCGGLGPTAGPPDGTPMTPPGRAPG